MQTLQSFVANQWTSGTGSFQTLVNPTTEEPIAQTSTVGIDMKAAMEFARTQGGPALRSLTFAQRGEILAALAASIHGAREELIDLAIKNGGNTRKDAKFDIDGASATLSYYANLGKELGETRVLRDGDSVQVGRTARLSGQHVFLPRHGVALHINAFNFPAWGLAEKAACALLAGMPVVSKPATATSLVAFRVMQLFTEQSLLPAGAFSFLCGSAGDILDHLHPQDVLAFTGSSDTAKMLRSHERVIGHSVKVNIEADSLNGAVIAPDVSPTSETGQLAIRDIVRDITQKAGQKCTAIRRILIPQNQLDDFITAISEELATNKVGNPADADVRVGPVATKRQQTDVLEGIATLAEQTESAYGGDGTSQEKTGFFVHPVLRLARSPKDAPAVHQHEVFGPAATVCVYDGSPEQAAQMIQLGQGGLVTSVYSDDRDYYGQIIPELGPFHGRLYLGSEKIAAQSPGPGTAMPMLLHGGPGRAGAGEELGGMRGLGLYQQRCALQGDKSILGSI